MPLPVSMAEFYTFDCTKHLMTYAILSVFHTQTLESTDMELPTSAFETPNVSGPPTTNRRAKSVPAHMLGNRSARKEETARNIHTSPAIFSLDRVMQGFRARSQLLVSR